MANVMAVGIIGRGLANMIIKGYLTYEVAVARFPDNKEEIDYWLTFYGHPELIGE